MPSTSVCLSCGRPVEQPVGRGRRRRWCSSACRSRGRRAQAADSEILRDIGAGGGRPRLSDAEEALAGADFGLSGIPAKDAAQALAKAVALAHELEEVAEVVGPGLAWRFRGAAEDLTTALFVYFGLTPAPRCWPGRLAFLAAGSRSHAAFSGRVP